jgi:toxin HigB-1
MIRSFADEGTKDIFNGINSKQARKRLDPSLHSVACRKLDMIDASYTLNDLKVPPANRLEALKGTLQGYYSIRINDQYRIIFSWSQYGAENVEIIDYH